eukprot:119439-Rhodomonas_salina.1
MQLSEAPRGDARKAGREQSMRASQLTCNARRDTSARMQVHKIEVYVISPCEAGSFARTERTLSQSRKSAQEVTKPRGNGSYHGRVVCFNGHLGHGPSEATTTTSTSAIPSSGLYQEKA